MMCHDTEANYGPMLFRRQKLDLLHKRMNIKLVIPSNRGIPCETGYLIEQT